MTFPWAIFLLHVKLWFMLNYGSLFVRGSSVRHVQIIFPNVLACAIVFIVFICAIYRSLLRCGGSAVLRAALLYGWWCETVMKTRRLIWDCDGSREPQKNESEDGFICYGGKWTWYTNTCTYTSLVTTIKKNWKFGQT